MIPYARFQHLSTSDFADVAQDRGDCDAYLDGLALIDDLVCQFGSVSRHPRFADEDDVNNRLNDVYRRLPNRQNVFQCLRNNAAAAQSLRRDMLQLRGYHEPNKIIEAMIIQFLGELAAAYGDMAKAYRVP